MTAYEVVVDAIGVFLPLKMAELVAITFIELVEPTFSLVFEQE